MEITIKGNDKRLLKQVEGLAHNLGLEVIRENGKSEEKKNAAALAKVMSEMAASGAFASIEDPVAWQREQRKDRPLPERE